MKFQFYFGPEKTSFQLSKNGIVESRSCIPFHGIISRGLLQRFIELNLDNSVWFSNAHKLFDKKLKYPEEPLKTLREHAIQVKVLSFDNSANVVKKYVLKYCEKYIEKSIETVECWNIKEGHTSSVWKVSFSNEKDSETFIVNVARDKEAGNELKESSKKLYTIGNELPNINCAKVYEIFSFEDSFLPTPTIITRNEWVENSFEIHVRNNKINKEKEFLLVERFLTTSEKPSKIISILGRLFSPKESKQIQKEINSFITKATVLLGKKIELSLNHGDVVWNGKQTMVVAIN